LAADGYAGAMKIESAANGFGSAGASDVDCAYGLIGSAAGWAGDSGYSDAKVGFSDLADVLG